ncbi:glyoxylate/hydroxypyruvate reductase HPR3-like [Carica papaya]|uniref:glyoxylate/hydroxypyruvate reductase HPR3-like n=1 Tax=Carica papaya TaxID=3649 RepID=UPI000B8CB078|nr:glyoxylate/hydroxypyruvate reductase HPR3-like [Carica papaya]
MEEQNPGPELPLVYVNCISFFFIFKDALQKHFRLLDPNDSTQSLLIPHARAIVCIGPSPLTSETLSLLPSLELVVCSTAGIDHIDLEECKRRSVAITNTGPAFADDGADYAIGLLIDVLRRLSAGDRYVRAGLWSKNGNYPLGYKVK